MSTCAWLVAATDSGTYIVSCKNSKNERKANRTGLVMGECDEANDTYWGIFVQHHEQNCTLHNVELENSLLPAEQLYWLQRWQP